MKKADIKLGTDYAIGKPRRSFAYKATAVSTGHAGALQVWRNDTTGEVWRHGSVYGGRHQSPPGGTYVGWTRDRVLQVYDKPGYRQRADKALVQFAPIRTKDGKPVYPNPWDSIQVDEEKGLALVPTRTITEEWDTFKARIEAAEARAKANHEDRAKRVAEFAPYKEAITEAFADTDIRVDSAYRDLNLSISISTPEEAAQFLALIGKDK